MYASPSCRCIDLDGFVRLWNKIYIKGEVFGTTGLNMWITILLQITPKNKCSYQSLRALLYMHLSVARQVINIFLRILKFLWFLQIFLFNNRLQTCELICRPYTEIDTALLHSIEHSNNIEILIHKEYFFEQQMERCEYQYFDEIILSVVNQTG